MNQITTFQIGQIVKYTNGNFTGTGTVKKVKGNNSDWAVVLDENDPSSFILWEMGYAIGDEIHVEQVEQVIN